MPAMRCLLDRKSQQETVGAASAANERVIYPSRLKPLPQINSLLYRYRGHGPLLQNTLRPQVLNLSARLRSCVASWVRSSLARATCSEPPTAASVH